MKILVSIILMFFVCVSSYAQIQPAKQATPPPKSTKAPEVVNNSPTAVAKSTSVKLQKTLGLNDNQKGEIYKAVFEHAQGMQNIQKLKLTNKEKYNKSQELDIKKTKKFEAIMTKEQFNKYRLTFP